MPIRPHPHHRALRVRKKMSGDRMPVKMIGDILTNQLPHMQPYIRFHLLPLEHQSNNIINVSLSPSTAKCNCFPNLCVQILFVSAERCHADSAEN